MQQSYAFDPELSRNRSGLVRRRNPGRFGSRRASARRAPGPARRSARSSSRAVLAGPRAGPLHPRGRAPSPALPAWAPRSGRSRLTDITPTLTSSAPASTPELLRHPKISGQRLRGPGDPGPLWRHRSHPACHGVASLPVSQPLRGSRLAPPHPPPPQSRPRRPGARPRSQPCGGFGFTPAPRSQPNMSLQAPSRLRAKRPSPEVTNLLRPGLAAALR